MINQEEYQILKDLDDRLGWLARDRDDDLVAYEKKPEKSTRFWFDNGRMVNLGVIFDVGRLFQFIQWEDEEPHSTTELIREYEDKGDIDYTLEEYAEYISKFSEKLLTESEEEIKKDKEWLKEEIESKFHRWYNSAQSLNSLVADVNNSINQLDEPKVLLQELPVIPKFVAEWIEGNKQSEEKWSDYDKEDAMNDTIHFTIYGLFADYPATNSHVELRKPVLKWLSVDRGNYFKLVNAVRYGYKVEEEPLYRARLKVITDKFIASYLRTQSSDAEDRLKVLEIGSKYIHEDHRHLSEFTENELKKLGIWGSEQWEVEELEVQDEEDEK